MRLVEPFPEAPRISYDPNSRTRLKNWHVYIIVQIVDAMTDPSSWHGLLLNPSSESYSKSRVDLITMSSCLIPLLYVAGYIGYSHEHFYELMAEDIEHGLLGLFELQALRKAVKMSLLISCLLSLQSIMESMGQNVRGLQEDDS